jgi:hypothetical protein
MSVEALSCGEFDQGAGHGAGGHTEIALRKRIKAGHLKAKFETNLHRYRSGGGKVLLKIGEEITECSLASVKEPVRMPGLRRPGSVRSVHRESVTLQYEDMFEVVGQDARRGQARHAGTDHDRLLADQSGRHQCLPFFLDPRRSTEFTNGARRIPPLSRAHV